jgi:hypothetical protein
MRSAKQYLDNLGISFYRHPIFILDDLGAISENNLRAKFYKLTRAGRKQLEIEEENWERLAGGRLQSHANHIARLEFRLQAV